MLHLNGKRLILASGSPRRRELLAGLDLDFEVDTRNNFNECFDPSTPFGQVPMLMARGKSHGFHRALEKDEILITADTMVILPGKENLGKPRDREDAFRMLRDLSGRDHLVITAVVLRSVDKEESFSATTTVSFKDLSDEEIAYYVDTYKPYDKAGAYAIQEWIGHIGISGIEGSYFNVVGFPVQRLYSALERFVG